MSKHYDDDCRITRIGDIVVPIVVTVFLTALAIYQLNQ